MLFDRFAKCAADGYPPCNIEEHDQNCMTITLAVAGFRPEDLMVTAEGKSLVIKGERREETNGKRYLHKGIANRRFQRIFTLMDPFEVLSAALRNGLLTIALKRLANASEVKHIPITPV